MAMKIDQMFRSPAVTGRRDQTSKNSRLDIATEEKVGAPATAGDKVTLTKSAHNLASLINSAIDMSEASIERIDELKNSIINGNYEINSKNIANKLLSFEIEL